VVSAGDTEEGLSVVLDGTTLEHGVVGGSVALGAAGQTSVWSNLGGSGGGGALTAFDDEVELTEEVESPPLPPLVPLWFAKSPDPDPSLLGAIDTVRVSDRERPFEERLKTPALTWIVE
jgi:hypothetical protein